MTTPGAHAIDAGIGSWLFLGVVIVVSLATDLFLHRGAHQSSRRAAAAWSVAWIAVALGFGAWISVRFGIGAGGDYFAAWLLEKSLSVDNLFVFLVVFQLLDIGEQHQHRVLFWGILGALATRALFIVAGTALLDAWHGALYVMGAFLIITGLKTATEKPEAKSRVLDVVARWLPVTKRLHGRHFFVREDGRRRATPLLLALVVIEISDVVFAVDSIPAVLAITHDPFIVYASNVLAVLGLRALYLLVAAAVARLYYLRLGLGAILVLVGAKMLASRVVHIPSWVSLGTVAFVFAATIVASLLRDRRAPLRQGA